MKGRQLTMRKTVAIVIVLTLAAFSAMAMDEAEHLEHLRMMLAAMSTHGPVIPQPETIDAQTAQTIAISAHATPNFGFTPNSFSVNQGDVVTISLSVAANDGSLASNPAHSLIMQTYVEQPLNCKKGQTVTVTFVATTPGTFAFVCNQPSCGNGHSSMIGTMIVNAASLAVTDVSPTAGTIAGGTQITITGLSFQNGATVTVGGSVGKVLVEQGVPLRLVGVQVSNMKPDDSVVEAQVAQKAAEARTAAIKTLTDFLDQDPTGTRKMVYRMQVLQELTRTANANGHNTIFLTDIGGPSAGILPLPSGR